VRSAGRMKPLRLRNVGLVGLKRHG
jgi:hypothetical protein